MKKVILKFLIILISILPIYVVIHRIIYIPQYKMMNTLQNKLMKEKISLIELNTLVTVNRLYIHNLTNGVTSTPYGYQNTQISNHYSELKNQLEKAQTNNKTDIKELKNIEKKLRIFKVAK